MPTLTKIDDFTNTPSGSNPQSTLISDAEGDLFGTTRNGGDNDAGAVFKLAKGSTGHPEIPGASFTGASGEGAHPKGGLVADANGVIHEIRNIGTLGRPIIPSRPSSTVSTAPMAHAPSMR